MVEMVAAKREEGEAGIRFFSKCNLDLSITEISFWGTLLAGACPR